MDKNATEIVKALTCDNGDCGSECPYYRWDGTHADVDAELEWCDEAAIKADAAALIEQQQAELQAYKDATNLTPEEIKDALQAYVELADGLGPPYTTRELMHETKRLRAELSALREVRIPKQVLTHKTDIDITIGRGRFAKGCTVWNCPSCGALILPYMKCCFDCGQAVKFTAAPEAPEEGE